MPLPRLPGILRVTVLPAVLSACATQPEPPPLPEPPPPKPLSAEQILRESQGMAQLGQRHKEGEDMVRQGESLVREGQARMNEGQRLIDAGRKIIRESEQGYSALKR